MDKRYIVLRNPYGKSKGDPDMPGYLMPGTLVYNITLGESDGIFALRVDQFVNILRICVDKSEHPNTGMIYV